MIGGIWVVDYARDGTRVTNPFFAVNHVGVVVRDLDEGAVAALMGGSPEELPEAYAAGDAARLLPGAVPVTVLHGELDDRVPVEMSRRLRGVELVELAGVEHFGLIDPLAPAWSAVLAAIEEKPTALS